MYADNTVLFYSILFYSILFYSILFYSILFYSILFYSILFYSILFYSILFYAMLCYVCYAMLCYAMLCYAILHVCFSLNLFKIYLICRNKLYIGYRINHSFPFYNVQTRSTCTCTPRFKYLQNIGILYSEKKI
jgi:hypothetical protein